MPDRSEPQSTVQHAKYRPQYITPPGRRALSGLAGMLALIVLLAHILESFISGCDWYGEMTIDEFESRQRLAEQCQELRETVNHPQETVNRRRLASGDTVDDSGWKEHIKGRGLAQSSHMEVDPLDESIGDILSKVYNMLLMSLFFTLSGFKMTISRYEKVVTPGNNYSWHHFLWDRMQKMLPVIFLSIALRLPYAISWMINAFPVSEYNDKHLYYGLQALAIIFALFQMATVPMWGYMAIVGMGWATGPSPLENDRWKYDWYMGVKNYFIEHWFLSGLFAFFLFFPAICHIMNSRRCRWIVSWGGVIFWSFLVGLIVFGPRFLAYQIRGQYVSGNKAFAYNVMCDGVKFSPLRGLQACAGCIAARIIMQAYETKSVHERFVSWVLTPPWWFVDLIYACFALSNFIIVPIISGWLLGHIEIRALGDDAYGGLSWLIQYYTADLMLPMTAYMVSVLARADDDSYVVKFFSLGPMQWLGYYAFAIYMFHMASIPILISLWLGRIDIPLTISARKVDYRIKEQLDAWDYSLVAFPTNIFLFVPIALIFSKFMGDLIMWMEAACQRKKARSPPDCCGPVMDPYLKIIRYYRHSHGLQQVLEAEAAQVHEDAGAEQGPAISSLDAVKEEQLEAQE